MSEQTGSERNWQSMLVAALLLGWAVLWMIPPVAQLAHRWNINMAAMLVLLLLHIPAAAGIGLRKSWGTSIVMMLNVATIVAMLRVGWIALLPFGPVMLLGFINFIGRLTGVAGFERPGMRLQRRHGIVLAIVALIAGVGFVGADEIEQALWSMRVDRWESRCDASGDPESCGRWAITALVEPEDYDEMRKGLAAFDTLCDQNIPRGCRFGGWLRSDAYYNWLVGEDSWVDRQRTKRTTQMCRDGNARGCMVSATLDGSYEVARRASDLCDAGDELGCIAAAVAAPGDENRARRACDLGFAPSCGAIWSRVDPCIDGDWNTCDVDGDDPEHELLRAFANARDASGKPVTPRLNPALYGIRIAADGLDVACEAGSAAACLALGLNATADMNPFEHQALPGRSLDATMGKACERGANSACLAYATRLLDRPFDEVNRNEKRAKELLETGCARGHADSCWLQALELSRLPDDLEFYRKAARMACWASTGDQAHLACRSFAHLLAADLGAAPWPILDSDAYHRLQAACLQRKGHRSCQSAADLVVSRSDGLGSVSVPPLWVRGTSIAEFSCRGGWAPSCETLFSAADRWQHLGMESRAALEKKICPQVPDACETGLR